MAPGDVEVGEIRAVGFVQIVVTFENRCAGGQNNGLEDRSRIFKRESVIGGVDEKGAGETDLYRDWISRGVNSRVRVEKSSETYMPC